MVYEFLFQGPAQNFFRITELLPSWKTGLIVALFSVPFMLAFCIFFQKASFSVLRRLSFLACFFSFVGSCIYTTVYWDEVFVNFEHPYNLFHHGIFSFSPWRMIDGTVEFFYYLLLTPFAFSQQSLIAASYVIGFAIAIAHLVILWKVWGGGDDKHRLLFKTLFIFIFTLQLPLIHDLSSGFGAGFLSLLLLIILYGFFKNNLTPVLILAGCLPLLRPDAFLYSIAVFFMAHAVMKRKIDWITALPLFSLGLYFLGVRYFYGHWIPVAATFKSFRPEMIHLISLPNTALYVLFWFLSKYHLPFTLSALISLACFAVSREKLRKEIKIIGTLCGLFGLIFIMYRATQVGHLIQNTRYAIGFIIASNFFLQITAVGLFYPWFHESASGKKRVIHKAMILLLIAIPLTHLFLAPRFIKTNEIETKFKKERVSQLAVHGQALDRLMPPGWKIATTELNAFGFFMEREIVDLWGYTNPEIAKSHICNGLFIKNNPDFFLKAKPEIAYLWNVGVDSSAEEILTKSNCSRRANLFGDVMEVIKNYDLFLLNNQGIIALLVRRDLTEEWIKILTSKSYFEKSGRQIDYAELKRYWESQPLVQYVCGKQKTL